MHGRITSFQRHNPTKAEYYKKQLQANTQALKNGKVPESWKPINKLLFKQDNKIQVKLLESV